MKNLYRPTVLLIYFLFSCGGGNDAGDPMPNPGPDTVTVPAPAATTLIFPENNMECNEGEIVNDNESNVTFEWNASENTDSYEVNIVNLQTNTSETSTTVTTNKTVVLQRGVPYEWHVVSKANGTTKTATSAKWKFYNQGQGVENYAPFPADAVHPRRGQTLEATTKVTLEWNGNDVDDDIVSYEVFFGTETESMISLGIQTSQTLETGVATTQIYYWKVIIKDAQGNTSVSEVFEFRVE